LLLYFDVPAAAAAWFVAPASFVTVGILAFTSVRGFLASLARLLTWSTGVKRADGAWGGEGGGGGGGGSGGGASGGEASPDADGGGGGGAPREHLHGALALIVAELLGTYLLSVLLLLRMSVPAEYRAGISRAVGDIHFPFFHRWFDVIFVLAACSAGIGHLLSSATRAARLGARERDRDAAGGAGAPRVRAPREAGHDSPPADAPDEERVNVGAMGGGGGGGSGGGGGGVGFGAARYSHRSGPPPSPRARRADARAS